MQDDKQRGFQDTELTQGSHVVGSPENEQDSDVLGQWTDDMFEGAIPEPLLEPSFPRTEPLEKVDNYPNTFIPPNIALMPYSAMCKVYYLRNNQPYVASGWIVHGNTGVKGIVTAGHVVYNPDTRWSKGFVVRRQYSNGAWAEQFTGSYARTLKGWIDGIGMREFWDVGAIIPSVPVPAETPSLQAVYNYSYNYPPYNFYYDTGYPSKPANGYPFDGEFLWESDGPLIQAHWSGTERALQAYNAMEQGSSGSPWMIYDATTGIHFAAGLQASGWDGTPSSYSPYFETRNIVALLLDIGVLRLG